MFELKYHTPFEWTEVVLADFNTFLQDHAAAEKKHRVWLCLCFRITQTNVN